MYDESATAPESLEGALDKMVEHGSLLTTNGWRGYVSVAHNHWHDVADSNMARTLNSFIGIFPT
jgi:hypothetical protein